jgi:hypothetical protein
VRVQLEDTDFDPKALMHGVIAMFLAQASTKGLHLSAIAVDGVPAAVRVAADSAQSHWQRGEDRSVWVIRLAPLL